MDIKQTQENGVCFMKAWWQNELIAECSMNCPSYDKVYNLYIAGNLDTDYGLIGQVKNFHFST